MLTVKFLIFLTPINFAVNTLRFKIGYFHGVLPPNDAIGKAESEGLDHISPIGGAV